MPLTAGTRLGPYEITGALGAGGMGEVYRARDTRLDRDVAIKVLPDTFAADPDRLSRFEREARAVAALSHPGILAIHDFGRADGLTYAVMELLEGSTLRARLDSAPLAPRRAIDVAGQIIRALGAAHEKGIVHRDIKPENIFITTDGHVKILDFGLARMGASPIAALAAAGTRTRVETGDGVVLGTVGYMSPEQVRGVAADHRSDIFSFGVVLYEMLTGRRPFAGSTAVETMNAILKEDPPAMIVSDAAMAPTLSRLVAHALEKEPAERFQSARDLAFSLEALRASSDTGASTVVSGPSRRRRPLVAAASIAVVALMAGLLAGRMLWRSAGGGALSSPTFTRLTYDNGTIWSGRFAPDGQTVVYGAAWDGGPIRTLLSRTDRPGSTPLNFADASLMSMSRTGELAISLGHVFEGWMGEGTLARVPMFGGAPRPIAERVREADWTPDGSDLAIVRRVDGRERLEFPVGKVLYDTSGYISHIRFSPDGSRIAFADHPFFADDNGDLAVVDREGRRTVLAKGFQSLRGVAWSPNGSEVWFTSNNFPHAGVALRAATLDGRTRMLLSLPTDWRILDVANDGRILLASEIVARHIEVVREGERQPQDVTLFEQSTAGAISTDGSSVLITDQGSYAGTEYAAYLRRLAEPAAVKLGEGQGFEFAQDMKWVLSLVYGPPSRILLLPVGAGETKQLPNPDGLTILAVAFLPDHKHVVYLGSAGNGPLRGYIQGIEDGARRPFTAEGVHVNTATFWRMPVTPDGSGVALIGGDGRIYVFPTNGGEPKPLTGLSPGEYPINWTSDGRGVYVTAATELPRRIFRVDLATGRRALWKELRTSQTAGIRLSQISMTPDGRTFLHSYARLLSNLYVAEGLRLPQ